MTSRPPRLAELLLWALLPPRYRDQQLGDLGEEFSARRCRRGLLHAWWWYWRQTLRSLGPNVALRIRNPRPTRKSRSNRMETLLQDLRYGIRGMRRSPAFAVVSTITLALAIGVNTAIFSMVNVVLFADLPMEHPETTTIFRSANQQLGVERGASTLRDYLAYRDNNESFAELAGWRANQWILTGGDEPLRVDGYSASPNFMRAWEIGPVAGRAFLEEEDQPGAPKVAILSHGFWTRHLGARLDVVGSTLRLDGIEHTVVGIMSPKLEFANLAEVEVWVPLTIDRTDESIDERTLFVTGRLMPGVTADQADRDIAAIGAGIAEELPAQYGGWETRVDLARANLLDANAERIMLLLTMAVGFVLLIACANVANMLLARGTARGREIAVRSALGAVRIRLVRQMLTESFVIAAAASVIGLVLSRGLMKALIWISDGQEGFFALATLDTNVLLFTLIVTIVTPLAFGLLPAMSASRADVSGALKEGTSRSGGRKGNRARGFLVTAQVSLALMLMVAASLAARSVIALRQRELGFDATGLLTMRVVLPEAKYGESENRLQFFNQMMQRVEGLPAVERVALSSSRPLVEPFSLRSFDIEGQPTLDDTDRPSAGISIVSPGYLDVVRMPLISGRSFSTSDTEQSFRVAMISREAERRYWNGQDPIGQRFKFVTATAVEWIRIVGVVGDLASTDQDERPDPAIYLPFAQDVPANTTVLVRTSGDPLSLAGPVRSLVWAIDPDQPIDDVKTMEQAIHELLVGDNALITLFVTFALFALVMASVGIYGVMAYSVSQRTSEISIRIALGAKTSNVRWMVLGQGGKLIDIGSVVGLIGALGISRLLSSLVVGISAVDPVTFIGVPAVLIAVGLIANYIPARRATRIDPMAALRVE